MKIFLAATTLLFSAIAPAQAGSYQFRNVTAGHFGANVDNSVTFENITVARGDRVYEIDASTTFYEAVCHLLGYENVLGGSGLNLHQVASKAFRVKLSNEGVYEGTRYSEYKITKVTCYNNGQLRPAIDFDRTINADGSVAITNVIVNRGDRQYVVDSSKTFYLGVCRAAGYQSVLGGAGLNVSETAQRYVVGAKLDDEGNYVADNLTKYRTAKATCYSGSEPELIVLVNGVRYRRQ